MQVDAVGHSDLVRVALAVWPEDAVGVRLRSLPMTPDRVKAALEEVQ